MASRWLHRFAVLLAITTFGLLVAGASVTSNRAGLAVPDWPTTYGQFMFAFPYAKWVGGIFYEHGHRLLASVVGLLTIVLALWIRLADRRPAVRQLGYAAVLAVIAQGVLGGLTVRFFLPPAVSIAHAGLAEAFFALTIVLALVTAPRWNDVGSEPRSPATRDEVALGNGTPLRSVPDYKPGAAGMLPWLALITTLLVYAQIVLGAAIRHANAAVLAHLLGGIVVLLVAGTVSVAAYVSVRRKDFILPAVALGALTFCQVWLGVVTLVVREPKSGSGLLDPVQVWLPTLHLAVGALIFAASVVLTLKSFRHLHAPRCDAATLPRAVFDLAKPRIVAMVLVTTTLGFFLGHHSLQPWPALLLTLLGVGLATAGAALLNNYLDRDVDARMERTRARALPAGLVAPATVFGWGVALVLTGVLVLARGVNVLTAFLVLLAAFLYVLVYTPLKRVSWWNTSVGALPGAVPPLAGWAAATGGLAPGAWVLFGILFAWQHPHFFAIAWMFRDDYRRAGLKMLPVVEPSGRWTFRQTVLFSAALPGVSLLLTRLGLTGGVYAAGAAALGAALLAAGVALARSHTVADARRLLKASVIYLPLLLLFILADAKW